jgi:uncharacterized damage-inducible protein DinB
MNPVHWRLSILRSLDTKTVHDLAQRAAGTLTSYRLVLGRCLLALHESQGYKEYGCSTATHYGCSVLGISQREAREARRVASRLLTLPRRSMSTEQGTIPWGKLREIVRKASPQTESYWLELAKMHSDKVIQALVSVTPEGALPGDVDTKDDGYHCELRCNLNPEVFQMLKQARRAYSLEREETVTTAQVLEWALASYLSHQPLDDEALEKVRQEADKDLQAERARQVPVLLEARELADEMSVLTPEKVSDEMRTADHETTRAGHPDGNDSTSNVDELLAHALGLP